jgi:excisionase family DNA binding protein
MTDDEDHGGLITVTVKRACEISGLGKSTIWEMIASGQLRSIKVAGRRLVGYASLRGLLEPPFAAKG